jgi:acetoacetyl-CoA synthetase
LEHLKEHRLHGGLGHYDVMLFQTTCGGMWNWLPRARDGCGDRGLRRLGHIPGQTACWSRSGRRVTVFGTSTYLQMLREASIDPERGDLS